MEPNFEVWLSNNRGMVAGSHRKGHNVFTNTGRDWLRYLISYKGIGPDLTNPLGADDPHETGRIRWIGVGDGIQAAHADVVGLANPLQVNASDWWKPLPAPVFVTETALRYQVSFGPAEIPAGGNISEFALTKGDGPTTPAATDPDHSILFYMTIPPLGPKAGNTLTLRWELRF